MIGRTLGNRYNIIEKVGTGGMAYVYKAEDKILKRLVAIKVLKEQFIEDQEFSKNLKLKLNLLLDYLIQTLLMCTM